MWTGQYVIGVFPSYYCLSGTTACVPVNVQPITTSLLLLSTWYNVSLAAYAVVMWSQSLLNSNDTRHTIFVPLAMSTSIFQKRFQTKVLVKQPEKKNHGHMFGQDRPEKTPPNVNSKRRDSESSTDIDRQHQRLRHEIWMVVRAVFTQRPVVRGGRRPGVWYKHTSKYLGVAV